MNRFSKRALAWAPRAICIIMTAFATLISFDAFDGQSLLDGLGRFAIHMLPAYLLVGMLVISWRREWIGAAISAGLGVLFLWWNHSTHRNPAGVALIIAVPFFAMGALYLANWLVRRHVSNA